ncbi:MAG: phasin [Pseudomonadota bacterium]
MAPARKTAAKKTEEFMAMPIEMPEAFRDMTEKSVENAKEAYAKVKAVAEDATDIAEDTFSNASKGVTEINLKTIDMVKDNANAAFEFTKSLFGVTTVAEMVELSTSYAREQYESQVSQLKEMGELVQKVSKDTAQPVTEGVQKTMKDFKVAV